MIAVDAWVRMVRWLCWALVGFAIVNAVITVGFALNIGAPTPPPEGTDLVNSIEFFRGDDTRIFGVTLLQSLSAVAVFLIAAILGAVVRRWAPDSPARDAMVTLFVIGGVLGIGANLMNAAVSNAATFGICDCGYRTEELIAQDKALSVAWNTVNWLSMGAVTLVGVGAGVAGRLLNLSSAWRTLSYAIAGLLLVAVALRLLAASVFVAAFDPFQVSNLLVAVGAGILVPIWAVMLSRGIAVRAGLAEPAS